MVLQACSFDYLQFRLEAKIGNLTHDFDGKLLYPYMKAEEYNALLLKELP